MKQSHSRPFIDCLLAICLISLAACGSPEKAGEAPAAAADQASISAEQSASDAGETDIEVLGEVVETEGLTTETAESDEIVLSAPATPAAAANSGEWKYKEGTHFRRMTTAQGTSSPPDKIEVAEVFWYGCPHCYNFDPILEEWRASLPANVAFVRIPVIWNPTNQLHARLMYTAEALGVLDQAHLAIFRAIHQEQNTLTTESDMVKLFAGFGVDEAAFLETYNSFGVTSAVKRAENLTRRYGIKSVPVLIINGKYATDAPEVRTFGEMVAVADELILREETERNGP